MSFPFPSNISSFSFVSPKGMRNLIVEPDSLHWLYFSAGIIFPSFPIISRQFP